MEESKFKPALISGVIFGILLSIPIIIPKLSIANCLCCGWLLACGAVAVKIYSNNIQVPLKTSQAALVGLIAGATADIFCTMVSKFVGLFRSVSTEEMRITFRQAFEQQPTLNAEQIDQYMKIVDIFLNHQIAFGILFFLIGIIMASGFGALGGVIASSFFNKGKTPPPTPPYGYGQSFGEGPKSSYPGN
jgi:hypothetical protein